MKALNLTFILLLLFPALLSAETFDLKKAIDTAILNNESVETARQELEKSEYVYKEAFSGALPRIDANVTYLRNLYSSKISNMEYYFAEMGNGLVGLNNTILGLHPESGLPQMSFSEMPDEETEAMSDNTIQAEISLIQPIWLGGKVGTALEIAKIYKDLNIAAFELEKNNTATEIKKNFYQILVLAESKRVMDLVKRDAEANLKKIEKLFEEGLVSEYDLIQARVRIKSIEPKIVSLDNYYELALDQLKINMGLDTDADIEISGTLSVSFKPVLKGVYDRALSDRLELKLLEYKRGLLEKNVSIENSNHLPNILGLANYSFQSQSDDLGDTFEKNHGVSTLNVGITATFPIFSGFGTTAKVDQARVEEKKATLEINRTKKYITLQVKNALSKLDLAEEELKLRDREIAEYEKALEITQVRYDNGLCTQLELTGAQTALENARLNKVNTQNGYVTALIDLESATGKVVYDEFK